LQVAVYRRGDLVVDAVAGVADHETGRPVVSDPLLRLLDRQGYDRDRSAHARRAWRVRLRHPAC
jgi:hypothetical protein